VERDAIAGPPSGRVLHNGLRHRACAPTHLCTAKCRRKLSPLSAVLIARRQDHRGGADDRLDGVGVGAHRTSRGNVRISRAPSGVATKWTRPMPGKITLNGSVRSAHLRMTPFGSRPARKDRHQSSQKRTIALGRIVRTLTRTTL
jgi:hypothetical protein